MLAENAAPFNRHQRTQCIIPSGENDLPHIARPPCFSLSFFIVVVNLIEGNHDHAHECYVNALLDLNDIGVFVHNTAHQSRLSKDLTGLPPAESYRERFRPPVAACLSDDRIAEVYVGIALRNIHQPEYVGRWRIRDCEKIVGRTRWEYRSHVESSRRGGNC